MHRRCSQAGLRNSMVESMVEILGLLFKRSERKLHLHLVFIFLTLLFCNVRNFLSIHCRAVNYCGQNIIVH